MKPIFLLVIYCGAVLSAGNTFEAAIDLLHENVEKLLSDVDPILQEMIATTKCKEIGIGAQNVINFTSRCVLVVTGEAKRNISGKDMKTPMAKYSEIEAAMKLLPGVSRELIYELIDARMTPSDEISPSDITKIDGICGRVHEIFDTALGLLVRSEQNGTIVNMPKKLEKWGKKEANLATATTTLSKISAKRDRSFVDAIDGLNKEVEKVRSLNGISATSSLPFTALTGIIDSIKEKVKQGDVADEPAKITITQSALEIQIEAITSKTDSLLQLLQTVTTITDQVEQLSIQIKAEIGNLLTSTEISLLKDMVDTLDEIEFIKFATEMNRLAEQFNSIGPNIAGMEKLVEFEASVKDSCDRSYFVQLSPIYIVDTYYYEFVYTLQKIASNLAKSRDVIPSVYLANINLVCEMIPEIVQALAAAIETCGNFNEKGLAQDYAVCTANLAHSVGKFTDIDMTMTSLYIPYERTKAKP